MNRLVSPLDEDWQATLASIARARGWPTAHEPARLGTKVQSVSRLYNAESPAAVEAKGASAMAARLGFSFVRDVPKGAAAVRELLASGNLRLSPARALRVLDLGAGLGAMTWGIVRGLEAAGGAGAVEAVYVDNDPAALELALEIVRTRGTKDSRVKLSAVAVVQSALGEIRTPGPFDVVILGQVLSELGRDAPQDARLEGQTAWIQRLVGELTADGSLVIVEPALRTRTRYLHALRDRLAAAKVTIFAPCLHAASCPALEREGDWCHEDLPIDLPGWLVPVARAAGLRWEGLTFSYLVLRKDETSLVRLLPGAGVRLRLVSDRLKSKGKSEAYACGEFAGALSARARVTRLDRDRSENNAIWDDVHRGDILSICPPITTVERLGKDHEIQLILDNLVKH